MPQAGQPDLLGGPGPGSGLALLLSGRLNTNTKWLALRNLGCGQAVAEEALGKTRGPRGQAQWLPGGALRNVAGRPPAAGRGGGGRPDTDDLRVWENRTRQPTLAPAPSACMALLCGPSLLSSESANLLTLGQEGQFHLLASTLPSNT